MQKMSVLCQRCNQGNLDFVKCVDGSGHVIDESAFDSLVEQRFEEFVSKFRLTDSESTEIGLKGERPKSINGLKGLRIPEDISVFLDELFDDNIMNHITEFEKARTKDEFSKILKSVSASFNTSGILKFEQVKNHIIYRDHLYHRLKSTLMSTPYQDYLKTITGLSLDETEMRENFNAMINFYYDQILSPDDELVPDHVEPEEIYSVEMVAHVLKYHLPITMIKKIDDVKQHFEALFFRYIDKNNKEYADFVNHIKHFLGVQILKESNCSSMIKAIKFMYSSEYLQFTQYNIKEAFNYSYEIDFDKISLKYEIKFKYPKNLGYKQNVNNTGQKFFDFLSLYEYLNTDEQVSSIVYKRSKTFYVKSENTEKVVTKNLTDYFLVNFENGVEALFDMYTSNCIITGESQQISDALNWFTDHGFEPEEIHFISFSGSLKIKTRAALLKSLLQEILKLPKLSKYWFTKSADTAAPKYIYYYSSKTIPTSINQYTNVVIRHVEKITMVNNLWNISFDGNLQSHIIPFISMLLSFLQMLENIQFDERFFRYSKEEAKYLEYYESQNKKTSSDPEVSIIANSFFVKREVYSRSVDPYLGKTLVREVYKPTIVDINLDDKKVLSDWRFFFASIILNMNRTMSKESKNFDELEIERLSREITINEKGITYSGKFISIRHEGKFYFIHPKDNTIHLLSDDGEDFMEKSSMVISNGVISLPKQSNSQRLVGIEPSIKRIIENFTDIQTAKTKFFIPNGNLSYSSFINGCFDFPVIKALVAQHTWDMSDEEIKASLEEINISLHQDLLQCVTNSLILYFESSDDTDEYKFKFPRHKYWYSVNTSYRRATFLFEKGKKIKVVYFGESPGVDKLDINNKIRNFIVTSNREPIVYSDVLDMFEKKDLRVEGQFFDTNGKSVGLRITKDEQIMDLRFDPQFPIMENKNRHGVRYLHDTHFKYLENSATNVKKPFAELDERFELIPERTTKVKYRISQIYESSRDWKQKVHLFLKAVITHWLILEENSKYDTDAYVEKYIQNRKKQAREDELMRIVMPVIPSNIKEFEAYYQKVYPTYFSKGCFRVEEVELQKIRSFVARELSLIKNYPLVFKQYYLNTRNNYNLMPKSVNEIIGETVFEKFVKNDTIKSQRSSFSYFTYADEFSEDLDPLSKTRNSKVSDLLIMRFEDRLYLVRFTKNGTIETARYVSQLWKNEGKLASYDEDKQEITSEILYVYRDDVIMMEHDVDGKLPDHKILKYNRNKEIVYAAMIEI